MTQKRWRTECAEGSTPATGMTEPVPEVLTVPTDCLTMSAAVETEVEMEEEVEPGVELGVEVVLALASAEPLSADAVYETRGSIGCGCVPGESRYTGERIVQEVARPHSSGAAGDLCCFCCFSLPVLPIDHVEPVLLAFIGTHRCVYHGVPAFLIRRRRGRHGGGPEIRRGRRRWYVAFRAPYCMHLRGVR